MKLILDRGGDEITFTPVGNGDAQSLYDEGGIVAPIDLTQASQTTKAGVSRSVVKASLTIPTTALGGDVMSQNAFLALPKAVTFEAHLVVSAPRTVMQLCRTNGADPAIMSTSELIVSRIIRAVVTAATDNSLQGHTVGPDGIVTNGGMPIITSLTGKQLFDPVTGTYGEASGS